MPHYPKPFFRTARKAWFVQVGTQQVNLGPDQVQAFRRYHELMQEDRRPVRTKCPLLVELIDEFLDSVQKNQAPDTFEWYRSRLQRFAERYPELEVGDLKPFHVQRWLDSIDGVKSGTKRNYARSIIRVMHWAEAQGLIDRSPLTHFRKPKAGQRETVISPEEFQRLLALTPGSDFRDLLVFAWETGARASECLALEKRHVDFENERVVFPQSEEKMERAPRVVYLTAATLEIVRRRCVTATGKVFRNSNGRPWTTDAVKCAFEQIQIRMGKEAMRERGLTIPEEEVVELTAHLKQRWIEQDRSAKTDRQYREMARFRLWNKHAVRHAPKYCLTVIRHSWCHRALKRGLDALTVSQLMGHADVTMVAKVYSHLSHAPDFLRSAMRRATATD